MESRLARKSGKRNVRRLVAGIAGVSLTVLLAAGVGGYFFARNINSVIHKQTKAAKAIDRAVTPAVPGEPLTFLLIGSDSRGKNDKGRSDTLMVARINPKKKLVSIISIPRDSRVHIPGHGMDKINAAYAYGDGELAIKTVKEFTGLDINHFIAVDWNGFKQIVDSLGGIDIDVQKRIRDNFDGIRIDLQPGMHHFDGQQALNYVRVRHVDSDFGRTERQQQFLKAVFQKALQPSSVTQLPQLARMFGENVDIDSGLGLQEMLSLGMALRSAPSDNIRMATLPGDCKMIGGVSYVIPDTSKTQWYLERMTKDLPFTMSKDELTNAEITVDVKNGSGIAGRGSAMSKQLKAKGFTVGYVGNAKSFDYYTTKILTSPKNEADASRVREALGVGEVVSSSSSGSTVTVVVGKDFSGDSGASTNIMREQ